MLSEVRIPIWLTEVDVLEKDPVKRADNLEAVMRTAFSSPSVQGLILWSFWSQSSWRGPYTSLVDGNEWKVGENSILLANNYIMSSRFLGCDICNAITLNPPPKLQRNEKKPPFCRRPPVDDL